MRNNNSNNNLLFLAREIRKKNRYDNFAARGIMIYFAPQARLISSLAFAKQAMVTPHLSQSQARRQSRCHYAIIIIKSVTKTQKLLFKVAEFSQINY